MESAPFLKIAIPFTAGILLFAAGTGSLVPVSCLCAALLLLLFLFRKKEPALRFKYNRYYLVPLLLLFTAEGWFCAYVNAPEKLPDNDLHKETFLAFHTESVRQRNVSTELTGYTTSFRNRSVPIQIRLQRNNYRIAPGDILYLRTEIQPIANSHVPESFDYASYMKHKGILYQGYVKQNDFIRIGRTESVRTKAWECRRSVIRLIRQTCLNHETANFIITILTGDGTYMNPDSRQLFTEAGLAHILAVSGLHIGIISLLLAWLLKPLDYLRLRTVRLIVILALIWAFTYFTGLPPSAVRAAVMSSFVLLSVMTFRKNDSRNALYAAATLILLFDPAALFDIGFQLSFLSVLGIFLFAKHLTFGKRFSALKYLSSLAAVSIAAQAGTLFATLHYFNTIPTTFLLGNIIVVPLLPVFMLLSLCAILLSSVALRIDALNWCLENLYDFFATTAELTGALPFSSAGNVWIEESATVLFCLAILLLGIWAQHPQKRQLPLLAGLMFTTGICTNRIEKSAIPSCGLLTTDEYTSTNIVFYDSGIAYIVNSHNDPYEITRFTERNPRFFLKYGIDSIVPVTRPFSSPKMNVRYPYVFANGIRAAFAVGNFKRNYKGQHPAKVDYLVVTNRYYNTLSDLGIAVKADTLIIPNEIYAPQKEAFTKEAHRQGLPVLDHTARSF